MSKVEEAIEAGIEVAAELVSSFAPGHRAWGSKEYQIAEIAARKAIEEILKPNE